MIVVNVMGMYVKDALVPCRPRFRSTTMQCMFSVCPYARFSIYPAFQVPNLPNPPNGVVGSLAG